MLYHISKQPVINRDFFTLLAGFWEYAVVDNIDEVYDWLVQHLCDSARATKRRLSCETLELIRHHGAAKAAGNYQLLRGSQAPQYMVPGEEVLSETETKLYFQFFFPVNYFECGICKQLEIPRR
ncbi:hypothetical protein ANCDUO_10064 [Ancylostoma duodenale]|uniref:Uncharacterized protein n=1 Tax=Ancylostoma duodenale TaxID=51022 RepID=A0A0C2GL66_9BILA|nr:hypothetical protein ANCDUO_10064 [Ancylostoma duodenale]